MLRDKNHSEVRSPPHWPCILLLMSAEPPLRSALLAGCVAPSMCLQSPPPPLVLICLKIRIPPVAPCMCLEEPCTVLPTACICLQSPHENPPCWSWRVSEYLVSISHGGESIVSTIYSEVRIPLSLARTAPPQKFGS